MAKKWDQLSDFDRDFVTDADLDDGFEESDGSKAERRMSSNQNRKQGQAAANVQADGATINLNIKMPNINIGKFDFSAAPKSEEKEAEKQSEAVKGTDTKGIGTKESLESLMVEGKDGQMTIKGTNPYEREMEADKIAYERSKRPITEREARERIAEGEFSTDVEPFMSDEEKSDALLREQEEREDRLYEEWLANKNGGNNPPSAPGGGSSAVRDVLNKAENIPDVGDRENETKLP